jgi:uncharacterized membrane protein (UPF0127 family)
MLNYIEIYFKNKIVIDMIVIINDKKFPAEVLTNPSDLATGMMGRKSLDGCMVFKMGKGYHSFWMEGCVIPLDIVFVSNNTISRIHRNCPPCDGECDKRYTGIGDHVIEFPAGTSNHWKVGDKVTLSQGIN